MHSTVYSRKPDRNDNHAFGSPSHRSTATASSTKKRTAVRRAPAGPKIHPFRYPDVPAELRQHRDELLVVGVVGKSQNITGNKMSPFDLLRHYPALDRQLPPADWSTDMDITFYYQPPIEDVTVTDEHSAAVLYMHILSPLDSTCLEHLPDALLDDPEQNALTLSAAMRSRAARSLLLVIQMCHIVCVCEPGCSFDAAQLQLFKALRSVRETFVVPTLPGVLRSSALPADRLGRDGRFCAPRFLFHFHWPNGACGADELRQLEFDMEDRIYKQLRHEFVITNNIGASLFSIPRNKRFVYVETPDVESPAADDDAMMQDALQLMDAMLEEFAPYPGFARKCRSQAQQPDVGCPPDSAPQRRSFVTLLREHLRDGLDNGFDDSSTRFKGKHQFIVPTGSDWFAAFDVMHALFVAGQSQPGDAASPAGDSADESDAGVLRATFDASCRRFRAQLDEQLDAVLNLDARFLAESAQRGCEVVIDIYRDMLPAHYLAELHRRRIELALVHLKRFVRLRDGSVALAELHERVRRACDAIWLGGRQQCEALSLRGLACTKAAHHVQDEEDDEDGGGGHQSTGLHISACNCGRVQGRRTDPFSVRQANYRFYQQMQRQCIGCRTRDAFRLPVGFGPALVVQRSASTHAERRALAPFNAEREPPLEEPPPAAAAVPKAPETTGPAADLLSQQSQRSFSLRFSDHGDDAETDVIAEMQTGISAMSMSSSQSQVASLPWLIDDDDDVSDAKDAPAADDDDAVDRSDDGDSAKAVAADVLADDDDEDSQDINYFADIMDEMRQAEPALSAAIDEAPPIVVEAPPAPAIEPVASPTVAPFPSWSLLCLGSSSLYGHENGLPETLQSGLLDGTNRLLPWIAEVSAGLRLKVFIGFEYECVRGHRFFMQSATRLLRTTDDPDDCRDVVELPMPLYVPCVCRRSVQKSERAPGTNGTAPQQPLRVAQLMRVHMVTPKAPVQLCVDPRVRVVRAPGDAQLFDLGLGDAAVLSQRAYWVLRMPFVYGETLPAPAKLADGRPWTSYGSLEPNMFSWIM